MLKMCPCAALPLPECSNVDTPPPQLAHLTLAADFSNRYIFVCLTVRTSNGVESDSDCQSSRTAGKYNLKCCSVHVPLHMYTVCMCVRARKHSINIHLCITSLSLSHPQTIKTITATLLHTCESSHCAG